MFYDSGRANFAETCCPERRSDRAYNGMGWINSAVTYRRRDRRHQQHHALRGEVQLGQPELVLRRQRVQPVLLGAPPVAGADHRLPAAELVGQRGTAGRPPATTRAG